MAIRKRSSLIKGIDVSKPVWVYRTLRYGRKTKPLYSVMQNGRVKVRLHRVLLSGKWNEDCKFVVREAGRQKVLKTKRKNVHAFVVGYIANEAYTPKGEVGGAWGIFEDGRDLPWKITYNPYHAGYFYHPEHNKVNGTPIRGAGGVLLNENGISACYTF